MHSHTARGPVSVIGLGPMGRALAVAFVAAGHPTTVWNRTPDRGAGLVGPVRAPTVAGAVRAGDPVVVCLRDVAALRAVLDPIADPLDGRTLVGLTTMTPEEARSTAAWAAARGATYLHGAVFARAVEIGGPTAAIRYSGPGEAFADHRSTLGALAGVTDYLGDDPGRAAAYDAALLDVFWTSVGSVLHGLALARAHGITGAAIAPLLGTALATAGEFVPIVADEFDAGVFPGDELDIVGAIAGIRRIIGVAERSGLETAALSAIAAHATGAIEAGHGGDGPARLAERITGSGTSRS